MRQPRIRLRTLMIAVALAAMMLALAAPAMRRWWTPMVWKITRYSGSKVRETVIFNANDDSIVSCTLPLARAQALAKPGSIKIELLPKGAE